MKEIKWISVSEKCDRLVGTCIIHVFHKEKECKKKRIFTKLGYRYRQVYLSNIHLLLTVSNSRIDRSLAMISKILSFVFGKCKTCRNEFISIATCLQNYF